MRLAVAVLTVPTVLAGLAAPAACSTPAPAPASPAPGAAPVTHDGGLPPAGATVVLLIHGRPSDDGEIAAVRALLERRGFVVDDQSRFARAIETALPALLDDEDAPSDLPPSIGAAWDEGAAACRAQGGAPPYADNALARTCAAELVRPLLERRWLAEAPGMIVELTAHGPASVEGEAFPPGADRRRWADADTLPHAAERVLAPDAAVLDRALRTALPLLPTADTPELRAGRAWSFDPMHMGGCTKPLPATLTVEPEVPLAMSIARAWPKMMPQLHTKPATPCTVRAFPQRVGRRTLLAGWLRCAGVPLAIARVDGDDLENQVANLAKALVDELASQACSNHG